MKRLVSDFHALNIKDPPSARSIRTPDMTGSGGRTREPRRRV